MNFLDILILLPVLYGAYKGFKHGFVIELFTLLAILVGIYVGIHFSDYTANWLKTSFGWDSEYLPVIESYDEKSNFFPEKTKSNSLLYEPVKDVSTKTVPALGESTIFLKNALHNETDSTGLSVDQVLRAKEIADSLGIDANDAKQILEIHQKYGDKDAVLKD